MRFFLLIFFAPNRLLLRNAPALLALMWCVHGPLANAVITAVLLVEFDKFVLVF